MYISILLATYNGEKFLQEQLNSILNQSYSNWHLYIHDDNSTDNTVKIIKEYVSKYPDHITFFDDDISFKSASLNFSYLMQKVSSDYLMFCDQDDVWKRDKIEVTLEKMKEAEKRYPQKPILVHTDLEVVDENLNTIDKSMMHYQGLNPYKKDFYHFVVQNKITGCTVMINSALAKLAQPIDSEAIMHDWWIALVASAFGKIAYVPKSTILYRQHTANDTGAKAFDKAFILKQAKELFTSDEKDVWSKYLIQARAFFKQYGDKLTPYHKEALEAFCKLDEMAWHKRVYILMKYRFLKQGLLRNIGLFLKL